MNKTVKTVVSSLLVSSMMIGMSGCSLFDKAGKLCTEIGDEFIQAALEREIEDMADLCLDDDEALDILAPYELSDEKIDCLLEKATFKAEKPDCSTKDGKGTITYVITLPDWEAALDEDPEDVDDFVDLIDDSTETTELKVKLTFKLKKDKWYITNADDFAEDFYGELYDIDFPFESYLTQYVDYTAWYGDYAGTSYLNMDVLTTSGSPTWRYYFEVYNNNGRNLIYTSEIRSDEPSRIESYCYYSETTLAHGSSNGSFESDTYRFVLYDADGAFICEDTVTI